MLTLKNWTPATENAIRTRRVRKNIAPMDSIEETSPLVTSCIGVNRGWLGRDSRIGLLS